MVCVGMGRITFEHTLPRLSVVHNTCNLDRLLDLYLAIRDPDSNYRANDVVYHLEQQDYATDRHSSPHV